jgi:acyl carrier protein
MGLGGVEIVMEVEDRLGIEIPMDAIPEMVTVGDLFEHVVAALKLSATEPKCLSARAFLSLRRAAMTLGARERLRPRDAIETLMPQAGRIEYWSRLQHESGLTLPPLKLPDGLAQASVLGVVIVSILAGAIAYDSTGSQSAGYFAGVAIGAVVATIVVAATRPFATSLPPECGTLGRLACTALRLNFQKLSELAGSRGRNDVWIVLREIIVDQLGVSPDAVTPSATFVKDLGVG